MESLGHGVPADELDEMMREAGIELSDADGGSIDLASFLEFIRRTLVADLPSSKLEHIESLSLRRRASSEEAAAADGAARGAAPRLAPRMRPSEPMMTTPAPHHAHALHGGAG